MKTFFALIALIIPFIVAGQEKDNQLTPEEFSNGWALLFDGSSMNGWKTYNGDKIKSWKVEENALVCDGNAGGDLMTINSYEDFDLKFEWKIEENGNSGVIYRVREGKQWSAPYLTGLEFQVFDDPNEFGNKSTGSIYDVYAPSKEKTINPAMNWNTGRIRISNGLIMHWVNGLMVLQCEIHSPDWKQKVKESKWKNIPYFGMSSYGHIDLQNHGSKVWYKNIKVKRLN